TPVQPVVLVSKLPFVTRLVVGAQMPKLDSAGRPSPLVTGTAVRVASLISFPDVLSVVVALLSACVLLAGQSRAQPPGIVASGSLLARLSMAGTSVLPRVPLPSANQ